MLSTRTTALLVGRPTSISDAHTDTKEPANLDDEEVDSGDFDPKGHSLMHPTEYTQFILRHRLAEIMGRISDHSEFRYRLSPHSQLTSKHNDSSIRNSTSRLCYCIKTRPGVTGLAEQITAVLCYPSSRYLFRFSASLLVCATAPACM